jgi:hypothetical protein
MTGPIQCEIMGAIRKATPLFRQCRKFSLGGITWSLSHTSESG